MASPETQAAGTGAAQTLDAASLLDQVVAATKQTAPDQAKSLVKTFVEEALAGTVTFDRNLFYTIDKAIKEIDAKLSQQLNAIIHNPKFLKLEGSWRGLHYLVMKSETGEGCQIRMLNASKRDLHKDLTRAIEFDQSQLFKKIYENEFGVPGGEPYGALIGDYEWAAHPEDVETLRLISNVAAASFCPFISGTDSKMLGLDSWPQLSAVRDLSGIFSTSEYIDWRNFRDSEDSRFVSLVLPRVLARLPYGANTKTIDEFGYEEAPFGVKGQALQMDHQQYCWMNSAYVLGTRLTDSFARTGFCIEIRGIEGGGKVEDLPTHVFTSEDGDLDSQCPSEIAITDRREAELTKMGFISLCHWKNTNFAAFVGGNTVQKPKVYDTADATANAAISARLPYIMATSRFAHYLKVMAYEKIGSKMDAAMCEKWLDRWIKDYVNTESPSKPLRSAKVSVEEIPGRPGSYNAVAYLQPWIQMESLTTSLRLVASIPDKK